jgi:hypothetical protein
MKIYLFLDKNKAELGYYDDSGKSCGESRSNLVIFARNIPIESIAGLIKYNQNYENDGEITLEKSSFPLVDLNVNTEIKPVNDDYEDVIVLDNSEMRFLTNSYDEPIYVHENSDWTRISKKDYEILQKRIYSYNQILNSAERINNNKTKNLYVIKRPKTENVSKILKVCYDIDNQENKKEELKKQQAESRKLQKIAKDKEKKEKLLSDLVKTLGKESVEKIISENG